MGQRPTLLRLAVAAAAGGLTGAALLLALPGRAFELVAPALIAGASLIVLLQPWLEDRPLFRPRGLRPGTVAAFYATAVYTGYFGAAALAFAVFGPVAWVYVVPLAAGLFVGGPIGPGIARRLPARALRLLIGVCGFAVAAILAWRTYL